MFNFEENLALSKVLMGKRNPSGLYSVGGTEVSYEALNETLRSNIKELTNTNGKFDFYLWNENKNTVFQLLSKTLSDVLPKNIYNEYGPFAEVVVVGQGDRPRFVKKIGRERALSFITKVGHASRYEVFELAEEFYDVQMTAVGGGARMSIEAFLDNRIDWAEYLEIVEEGMRRAIFKEVARALQATIKSFPATNKVSAAGFDEAQFDRLVATVSAYGQPVIYGTYEALATIIPANNNWSDKMKDNYYNDGYFTHYKGGVPMIVLPQSFEAEDNKTKVIDPRFIYIFPANSSKPVKLILEGDALVKEFNQNTDWSTEIHTYQKFGIAVETSNNLAVFANTNLSKTNTAGTWSI